MSSPAVSLADRGQVVREGWFLPGVRAYGNLGAEARRADAHAIKGIRKQVVRREFVVDLYIGAAEVEKHHSLLATPFSPDIFERAQMLLEQGTKPAGYSLLLRQCTER